MCCMVSAASEHEYSAQVCLGVFAPLWVWVWVYVQTGTVPTQLCGGNNGVSLNDLLLAGNEVRAHTHTHTHTHTHQRTHNLNDLLLAGNEASKSHKQRPHPTPPHTHTYTHTTSYRCSPCAQ